MPGEATTVGEIVAYLRMDRSQYKSEIAGAKADANDLGRTNPKITITTNAGEAIAQIRAVSVARDAATSNNVKSLAALTAAQRSLANSSDGVIAAQQRLAAAQERVRASGVGTAADYQKIEAAERSLASATRNYETAADRASLAQRRFNADLDKADASSKRASRSSSEAARDLKLLSTALIGLGPAVVPLGAETAAAVIGIAPAAATVLLAVKGIKTEMAQASPVGKQYTADVKTLRTELTQLESISAHGVLGGVNQGVAALKPLFSTLNRDTAVFSTQLGQIVGHVAPGLVSLFHQLDPLFMSFGEDLVGGAAKFEKWAGSSQSVAKLVGYVQAELPHVGTMLGQLATTVGHLVQGFAPFGGTVVQELEMFSRVMNAIPIGVLQTVIPLLAGAKVGMLGFNGASNAAASIEKVASKAGAAAGTVSTLGKAVGYLGPVGLVAGVALGGLSLIMGRHQQAAAEDATRVNALTQAIESQRTAVGVLAALQSSGASDAALKLGISQQTLVKSVLEGGTALDNVKGHIATTYAQYKQLSDYLSSTQGGLDSTRNAGFYKSQMDQFHALGDAMSTLSSKLQQTQADYAKAKQAAAAYAAAQGDSVLASQVQSGEIDKVAKSLGLTADAYFAAKLAADQNKASVAAQTAQMVLANDAAGLLTATLDKLNGGNMAYAQAQNQFDQDLVNMAKHIHGADAELRGMSSSAVKNTGDLITLARGAETAAEAFAKQTDANGNLIHGSEASRQKLIQLRAQLIDNAVSWGENRTQVTALIDSILHIPPKATTTGVLLTTAAEDTAARYRATLATLPSSIRETVALYGMQSAEYQLELLARNRTAQITVTTGGQGVTGERSVGGVKTNAAGGGVPDGWSTVGEQGWEAVYKRGDHVQVFSNAASKRILPQGPSVPAFAGGTDSGIVTLTPSKSSSKKSSGTAGTKTPYAFNGIYYSTALAATNARTRAAQAKVTDSIVETAGGGQAYGIASYLRGSIPSVAAAAKQLSAAVNDAFTLKGLQAKIAAVKADLTNLRQQQSSLSSAVGTTLSANTDPSQFGSVADYTNYLQGRTAGNQRYAHEMHLLRLEKVPTSLLAQYATGGPSAGLDALAGATPAQRAALARASAGFNASVSSGQNQAAAIYAPAIAKDNANLAKYTAQSNRTETAMVNITLRLAQLLAKPIEVKLDGKTLVRAEFANGQLKGVVDELHNLLVTGRTG